MSERNLKTYTSKLTGLKVRVYLDDSTWPVRYILSTKPRGILKRTTRRDLALLLPGKTPDRVEIYESPKGIEVKVICKDSSQPIIHV